MSTEEDLTRLRPLVEQMASERTHDRPDLWADCVQEGMIAAWSAMEARPGKAWSYYVASARNGVISVLRGRPSTGASGHQGKRDAQDTATALMVTGPDGNEYPIVEPTTTAPYDAVEVEGVIRDAVAALEESDRALVFARYWRDLGFREIAAEVGTRHTRLEWRWREHIRPVLRARLEGLRA